jgi:magnesium chelatase subunit I
MAFRSQGRAAPRIFASATAAPVAGSRTSKKQLVFPFTRIQGQEDMKLALLLNVVDPNIGGVLIMGDRGTAKSVAVRTQSLVCVRAACCVLRCVVSATTRGALGLASSHPPPPPNPKTHQVRAVAQLLPMIDVVEGDSFNSSPTDPKLMGPDALQRFRSGEKLPATTMRTPLVELPLGATEDRICGTIDIEKALTEGVKAYEPGLLVGSFLLLLPFGEGGRRRSKQRVRAPL